MPVLQSVSTPVHGFLSAQNSYQDLSGWNVRDILQAVKDRRLDELHDAEGVFRLYQELCPNIRELTLLVGRSKSALHQSLKIWRAFARLLCGQCVDSEIDACGQRVDSVWTRMDNRQSTHGPNTSIQLSTHLLHLKRHQLLVLAETVAHPYFDDLLVAAAEGVSVRQLKIMAAIRRENSLEGLKKQQSQYFASLVTYAKDLSDNGSSQLIMQELKRHEKAMASLLERAAMDKVSSVSSRPGPTDDTHDKSAMYDKEHICHSYLSDEEEAALHFINSQLAPFDNHISKQVFLGIVKALGLEGIKETWNQLPHLPWVSSPGGVFVKRARAAIAGSTEPVEKAFRNRHASSLQAFPGSHNAHSAENRRHGKSAHSTAKSVWDQAIGHALLSENERSLLSSLEVFHGENNQIVVEVSDTDQEELVFGLLDQVYQACLDHGFRHWRFTPRILEGSTALDAGP